MTHGLILALIITAAGLWLCAILALAVVGRRTPARELARFLPNLLLLFRGLVRDPGWASAAPRPQRCDPSSALPALEASAFVGFVFPG